MADPKPFVPPDSTVIDGLLVRSYRPGDGPAMATATNASHEHLSPWMAWATGDDTPEEAEVRARLFAGKYLACEDFVVGIWDGDVLVGGSGFHPRWGGLESRVGEIGMWIAGDRAGQGVGTAILRGLVEWGLSDEWCWDRLVWCCDSENVASARTAQKAGFTLEGRLRGPSPNGDGVGREATLVYGFNRADLERPDHDVDGADDERADRDEPGTTAR